MFIWIFATTVLKVNTELYAQVENKVELLKQKMVITEVIIFFYFLAGEVSRLITFISDEKAQW